MRLSVLLLEYHTEIWGRGTTATEVGCSENKISQARIRT